MELLSLSKPNVAEPLTRRTLLLAPVCALAGAAAWYLSRSCPIPDPAQSGTGQTVEIILFSDKGERIGPLAVHKISKPLDQWRRELDGESFSVTREEGTEFSFHNLYWNNEKPGIYRCVCCGNALFQSADKFDSGTGWPSFTTPIAAENAYQRTDRSLGMARTEVLCSKCDAHLGHVFNDGPPPSGLRYCMNSAALRFIPIHN